MALFKTNSKLNRNYFNPAASALTATHANSSRLKYCLEITDIPGNH